MFYVVESDDHFLAGCGDAPNGGGWTFWTADPSRAHRFLNKAEAIIAAKVVDGIVLPCVDGQVKESK